MGWNMHGMGQTGSVYIFLMLIAFLIAGYFVAVYTMKQLASEHDDALHILKKRYTQGELTKEEFNEMKKDLTEV